jgi:AmmeMemoRadiSam system protein A
VPTPSRELSPGERAALLALARGAVAAAVGAARFAPAPWSRGSRLAEPGASFVTLTVAGELRGCVGTLEPHRALAEDVIDNARAAALRDPRFPPLAARELAGLDLHLSILGPPRALAAADERALLAALRPGIDGLVVEEGDRRATFLPAVWEKLPEPREFLAQLRRKAGLPPGYWSPTLIFRRYEVEELP